jgi:hypothetical protein
MVAHKNELIGDKIANPKCPVKQKCKYIFQLIISFETVKINKNTI